MAERYQREIEEILAEAGEEAPRRQAPRRRTTGARPLRPSSPQRRGFSLRPTPGRLAFAGVASLAVALALNLLGAPGASVFLWVGVALFVAAYVSYFTQPRRTTERRWRGEVMDAPPSRDPLSRLWRRITGG